MYVIIYNPKDQIRKKVMFHKVLLIFNFERYIWLKLTLLRRVKERTPNIFFPEGAWCGLECPSLEKTHEGPLMGGGGGYPCRMSILRNVTCHMFLSLIFLHVACHYQCYSPVACH